MSLYALARASACERNDSDYTAPKQWGPQFRLFSLWTCLVVASWAKRNMRRDRLQSLYLHCFWHPGKSWRCVVKGELVRTKPEEACRHWICSEQIINFFSSLYIVKCVEKEHQLKIRHSGPSPAWQILSSLLHGQASLLHVIILVLGLVQQLCCNVRWSGVWKREGAVSISRQDLGRSARAACMLQFSREGFSWTPQPSLCCLEFGP